MLSQDNTAQIGSNLVLYFTALCVLLWAPWFFSYYKAKRAVGSVRTHYITTIFFSLGWCMLITATKRIPLFNLFGNINHIFILLIPLFCIMGGYAFGRTQEIKQQVHTTLFVCFVLLCLQYIRIYFAVLGDDRHIGVSYYPLVMLPLVLLNPKKLYRWIAIGLTCLVIFSSVKRGGMVALILALLAFVFVKQMASQRNILKAIIIILGTILLMGGAFYYLSTSFDTAVWERIANASDDGGSGRLDLWAEIGIQLLVESKTNLLIGNGFRATMMVTSTELPAHNDFIEIIYDFGVIGLVSYLISIIILFVEMFRMIKQGNIIAAPFAMMLVVYLILSMVSIVILYNWLTIFAFGFGLFIGIFEKESAEG